MWELTDAMVVTSATAAGKAAQAAQARGRGQAPRADPVGAPRPNFGTRRGAPLPTQARRKDDGTAMEDIFSPSAFLAEEEDFSAMALARTSDSAAVSEVAAAGVRRGRRKRNKTSKAIAAESKSTAHTPPASSLTLSVAQVPAPSSGYTSLGQKSLFPPVSSALLAEDEDTVDGSPSAVAMRSDFATMGMEEMSLSSAHLKSDDSSTLSPQKFSSARGSFTSGLVLDPATMASLGPADQNRIRSMEGKLSIGAGFLAREHGSYYAGVLPPTGGSDGGEDDTEALMANVPSAEAVQARKDGRKLQIDFPDMMKNHDQFLAGCVGSMMASFQDQELKAKAAELGVVDFNKAVNAGGGLSKEDQRWEAGFEKVEICVRTTGYVNSLADESAYRWLEKQKAQVAKGELSEEKIARLQKLGIPIGFDPKSAELPPPTDGTFYSPSEVVTILQKNSHLNNAELFQLKERLVPLTPLQTVDQISRFVRNYGDTEDPESLAWEDIFPYTASVRTALAATAAFTSPVPAHDKENGIWALYMNHAHDEKKFAKNHEYTEAELDAAATEALVLSFFQAKKELTFGTAASQMSNLGNLLQHTDVGRALKTVKSTPGTVFHEYLKTCKGVPAGFGKGRGGHNHTKPRKTQASCGRRNEALRGVGRQPAEKRSNDGGGKQQPKQRKKAGGGKQPARKQGKTAGGGRKKRAESDAEEFDAEEFYAEAPAEYTNFTAI